MASEPISASVGRIGRRVFNTQLERLSSNLDNLSSDEIRNRFNRFSVLVQLDFPHNHHAPEFLNDVIHRLEHAYLEAKAREEQQ